MQPEISLDDHVALPAEESLKPFPTTVHLAGLQTPVKDLLPVLLCYFF